MTEARNDTREFVGPALRWLGRGGYVLIILAGLTALVSAVDLAPYVGSPQFDYVGMDFSKPFWPQILGRTVPFGLTGAFLAVLGWASVRGSLRQPAGLQGWARSAGGWAAAAFAARLCWGGLGGSWDSVTIGWLIRYSAINAVVSAMVLLWVQAFFGRYATWRGRPRTRFGEAALWFAISALATVAFLSAMTILGDLSVSRLVADAPLMIGMLGGLLAFCIAILPRTLRSRDAVGPAGLEPATRPL